MRATITLIALFLATAASADDLTTRIRGSNQMIDDVRELCDRVGGRPTGSANEKRAEDWAAKKLRDAGVAVSVESYMLPSYWESKTALAACTAPASFPLRIAAAPFSASTPNGDPIDGALIDFGDGSPDALAKVRASPGKIAFVHTPLMTSLDDLFGDYMRVNPLLQAAKKSGVKAMLIESSQRRSLLYRHPVSLMGEIVPLPVAIVARDNAERLARLLATGEVHVRVQLVNEIAGPTAARNVIGEIKGTDKADEIVLFGAHLDSWDLGTGALDNGVNAATVIDLARQIKALGLEPRRTIRFALFTGEENGMLGSRGYTAAHRDELPRMAMMLTADIGSGKTTGFFLNGREELRPIVEAALAPFIPDVKNQQNAADALDGTDNFDFLLWGVPNLVANQDPTPYLPEYHAESDTFDKVDVAQAKENEAVDAAVVWQFANAPSRVSQQSRADIEKLLAASHLDDQMKAFGQWDEWVARKRGLPN